MTLNAFGMALRLGSQRLMRSVFADCIALVIVVEILALHFKCMASELNIVNSENSTVIGRDAAANIVKGKVDVVHNIERIKEIESSGVELSVAENMELAQCYEQVSEFLNAIKYSQKVLAQDASAREAYGIAIRSYLNRGDLDDAIKVFSLGLSNEIDSLNSFCFFFYHFCYQQGDYVNSKKYLDNYFLWLSSQMTADVNSAIELSRQVDLYKDFYRQQSQLDVYGALHEARMKSLDAVEFWKDKLSHSRGEVVHAYFAMSLCYECVAQIDRIASPSLLPESFNWWFDHLCQVDSDKDFPGHLKGDLWERFCEFVDLNIGDFSDIGALSEYIIANGDLKNKSNYAEQSLRFVEQLIVVETTGRKIMGHHIPDDVLSVSPAKIRLGLNQGGDRLLAVCVVRGNYQTAYDRLTYLNHLVKEFGNMSVEPYLVLIHGGAQHDTMVHKDSQLGRLTSSASKLQVGFVHLESETPFTKYLSVGLDTTFLLGEERNIFGYIHGHHQKVDRKKKAFEKILEIRFSPSPVK